MNSVRGCAGARRILPERCEVCEQVRDFLVREPGIGKHAAPGMAVADGVKPSLVVFQFQRRTIAKVRGRGGQPCHDCCRVRFQRGFPVDHAVDAVAVVADPLAVEQRLPLGRITFGRGICLGRCSVTEGCC